MKHVCDMRPFGIFYFLIKIDENPSDVDEFMPNGTPAVGAVSSRGRQIWGTNLPHRPTSTVAS